MENKIKISFILNIIIFILVFICFIFMLINFNFMSDIKVLESHGLENLKYFTVDSNLLLGISSLILSIYEYLYLNKKIKEIPNKIYLLKYISTICVMITFLVVTCFFAPFYFKNNFYVLYLNNNLFYHLIVPILAFISYIFFEKNKLNFKTTFTGIIPVILYSIFYITRVLNHMENNKIIPEYDFYGFMSNGINGLIISIPIMIILTYIISLIIYKLNKLVENN